MSATLTVFRMCFFASFILLSLSCSFFFWSLFLSFCYQLFITKAILDSNNMVFVIYKKDQQKKTNPSFGWFHLSCNFDCFFFLCKGKYINGTTIVVDGGLWLSRPRHLPKEAVKQLSRTVEKRSRAAPVGVPHSKL